MGLHIDYAMTETCGIVYMKTQDAGKETLVQLGRLLQVSKLRWSVSNLDNLNLRINKARYGFEALS